MSVEIHRPLPRLRRWSQRRALVRAIFIGFAPFVLSASISFISGPALAARMIGLDSLLQLWRIWERDIPSVLRAAGLVHESPEHVALRALGALDRSDQAGVMELVDRRAPDAHIAIYRILVNWPMGALQQQGAWGSVGPYASEAWYDGVPTGSVRQVPVRLVSKQGTMELILRMRLGPDGWRIISARLTSLPAKPAGITQ